ncbi:family 10 glycosylhydrolase [Paenibacillus sp. CMAA1364]
MKLRKWTSLILIMIILLPGTNHTTQAKSAKEISIILDGMNLKSDVAPYINPKLNVTMVPLRIISEGLGANVQWSQSTRTVTITKGPTIIQLTNGKKIALINGSTIPLDASVDNINNRIMVPLRFVGEALGLQVNWNQIERSVNLISQVGVPDKDEVVTHTSLRGVWVSTVYNLDWPSLSSSSNVEKQKKEYIQLVDQLQAIGFNSVFVQIRPSGDAFYTSDLVPWSKTLTGKQGVYPGYDPLQFMIDETHARGMEFHAWFNPFRANTDTSTANLASNHVRIQHPEWIVATKNQLIINPGIPDARDHVIDVIMEVVRNYNIDGVHLDDYFYPTGVAFNDDYTFKVFNAQKIISKADWRRNNVNQFIQKLNTSIQTVKPQIAFGVSPFGVWRNKSVDATGSSTKAGITSYDDYYADVRTWIKNDWIDYVAPQLYWSFANKNVQYDTLVQWWVNEIKNTNVELYVGHAPYKLGTSEVGWQSSQEIINQLKYNEAEPQVQGSIFFSSRHILNNPLGLIPELINFYNK